MASNIHQSLVELTESHLTRAGGDLRDVKLNPLRGNIQSGVRQKLFYKYCDYVSGEQAVVKCSFL